MVSIAFMVAGMSSRFGGKPKQLEKVGPNEETLIEYSVKQALQSPFQHLYFITNPKTEHRFREIFSSSYQSVPITYIPQIYDTTQRHKPWGTSDAIANLAPMYKMLHVLLSMGMISMAKIHSVKHINIYKNIHKIISLECFHSSEHYRKLEK